MLLFIIITAALSKTLYTSITEYKASSKFYDEVIHDSQALNSLFTDINNAYQAFLVSGDVQHLGLYRQHSNEVNHSLNKLRVDLSARPESLRRLELMEHKWYLWSGENGEVAIRERVAVNKSNLFYAALLEEINAGKDKALVDKIRALIQKISSLDTVKKSNKFLLAVISVEKHIIDAETGMRGYLLTGKDWYLQPYATSQNSLPQIFETIYKLSKANSQLTEMIKSLDVLYLQWLNQVARIQIDARVKYDHASRDMSDITRVTTSKNYIRNNTRLREQLDAYILGLNKTLLDNLNVIVDKSVQNMNNVVVLSVAGLVVFLFTVYLISRSITKPMQTLTDGVKLFGDGVLDHRIEVNTEDEMKDLASAFNNMASQIETSQETLEDKVTERTEELRTTQEQLLKQEKLATLGQLIAIVSHELRNPLGTIHTSIYTIRERLKNNRLDKELGVDRALDRAERNITRCDVIIEDMLDYTRDHKLIRQPTEIDNWLHDELEEIHTAEAISLIQNLHSGILADIDVDRFRRCLINLINNAAEAILAGEKQAQGQITVSSKRKNDRLLIEIADNGPGMDTDTLNKIFEPLFSTKSFGIGLGLTIAKQIIEQHTGELQVRSIQGEGTHMLVWLPLSLQ